MYSRHFTALAVPLVLAGCGRSGSAPAVEAPVPPPPTEAAAVRSLAGVFLQRYGDPPPEGGEGAMQYLLSDDSGRTIQLLVDEAIFAPFGGSHALQGQRVTIRYDSTGLPDGTVRVLAISRP